MPNTEPDTKALPRLLCLHGGGVNAAIFKAQSRSLIRHLKTSFRLVWADAPFLCDPHADVVNIYSTYAPYRRWFRWLPEHAEIDAETCIQEIGHAMRTTMKNDDRKGATGEWIGLIGFSQGAKLAASILLEQQARETKAGREGLADDVGFVEVPGLRWKFGVLFAGSAPLSNLNPGALNSTALIGAGDLLEKFHFGTVPKDAVLRIPTLHVHGMADSGLGLHQRLLHDYCSQDSTSLIEWEGAHRIPLKSEDVGRVVRAIYNIAERTGVKVTRTV